MTTYSLVYGSPCILQSDGLMVPPDPANPYYQNYLTWVSQGNTATPAPNPTTIQATEFLNRFTQAEQIAIQTACLGNAQLTWGLTIGLAQGFIILNSPILSSWLAALVTAGAITQARATAAVIP